MKLLVAALVVGFSFSAFAQNVGTLQNIQGVVTVSSNGVVNSVSGSANLVDGSVVLNSGTGSSVVQLTNGCTVTLKPNEVLTINAAAKCADLTASVKTVAAPLTTVAEMTSYLTAQNLLIAGGILGAGAIIVDQTKNKASGS
jgi:ABC-type Fe3+ transport system substrate-binding protein